MKQELFLDIAQRIPQGAVSRAWGWLARRQQPRPAVSVLKHLFVRAAGIEMQDAEGSVASYSTLQELFVRSLRPGARIIDPEPSAVVSPVDGCVGACGVVDSGTLLQVKGRSYSLARLLGDPAAAKRFEGGAYATVYLAPKDYHRIHAPVSGAVSAATLIPGRLFPVFPEALRQVDELFARNERIITYLESAATGRLAVVKVGATLVGHISVTYDVALRSNESGEQRPRYLTYDPPRIIQKGAQLGAFELGSTVVVIAERNRITFDTLREGMHVRMGERIGTVAVPATGTAAC